MAPGRSARLPFLAALLTLSGACALVYQMAWLREFRLVFGGATPATASVLAIFMAGLGAGSAWFGRRIERAANPLKWYALIETGVGVSALLTPFLISAVRSLYTSTGGVVGLGLAPATLVQLALASAVLAVPCFLMGGSLPAAFKWAETDADPQRGALGVLYGLNTLGALTGVVVSTFWLLEHWGIRATVFAAAGVNLLIGATAWVVAQRHTPGAPVPKVEPALASPVKAPPVFVYVAAGVTGFTFFLSELVWFRMLAPLVGSSVYGFGLILALALAGIGLGGLWYRSRWASRAGAVSLGALALIAAWQAVLLALPWALGDRIAVLAIDLSQLRAYGVAGQVFGWTLVSSLLVAGPALMAGIQFPMLVGLLGEGTRDAGRHVGYAYAANTFGAIAGSLLGGFILLPMLTAPGCWWLVVFMTAALSVGAWLLSIRSAPRRMSLGTAALVVGSMVLLTTPDGPSAAWRHEPAGYGRVDPLPVSVNGLRDWLNAARQTKPFAFEGREASVAIASGNNGWSFFVNGKADGAAFGDANTQVMLGLLPAMLHAAPTRAFVVGLGTGSTAGWLADVPGMAQVDVVELEPGMPHLAGTYFAPVNRQVMAKPNVNLIIGDARETLLVSGPSYDLILSEPSNPYRAGVATLFTQEYYEAVRARLGDGGLFAQWLQGYEVDSTAVQLVYATLTSVFPYVETWATGSNDLVFITHQSPPSYSLEQLRRRVTEPPFAEALTRVWFTRSAEGVLAHHLAGPDVARVVSKTNPTRNTDDQNLLEYGFARALAQPSAFNLFQILSLAAGMNADVPSHLVGQVNRTRIQQERLLMMAADGTQMPAQGVQGDDLRRAEAVQAFVDHRYADVLNLWVGDPASPMEELLLLEAATVAGTPEQVRPLLERVLASWPAEARFAAARTAFRHGAADAAVDHLREGFSALRTQVWAQPERLQAALGLASQLAVSKPERARQFLEWLREPFPGGMGEISRLNALVQIGLHLPAKQQAEVAAMFEPNPPWTRVFLEFRVNAYRRAGDLRAGRAEADFREFLRHTDRPLNEPMAVR